MIEGIQNIILYNVYREFYEEEPNLSIDNKDKLNVKMQALIFLLKWFDITLGQYHFEKDSKLDMPISKELSFDIDKTLVGKDNVKLDSYDVDINNDLSSVIELLSNKIINKSETILKELCNILYDQYFDIEEETKILKKHTFI